MPSNAPSTTTLGSASGGEASGPGTIRGEVLEGFARPPVRRARPDAEHPAGGVVDADGGAGLAPRRRSDLDRLAMHERGGRPLVEGDTAPARQRGLGRLHA